MKIFLKNYILLEVLLLVSYFNLLINYIYIYKLVIF